MRGEPIRLQKILSDFGICSRRQAEAYILQGRVQVNGIPAQLGDSADPEADRITLDGKEVKRPQGERLYLMLNKPKGYVCTLSDEKGRRTVIELLGALNTRVYPVGRLDLNSEGLLVLTNDGEFANRLTHPRFYIKKTYELIIDLRGALHDEPCERALAQPFMLDGYETRPAKCTLVAREGSIATLSVSIGEGRNRQIRRMCEQLGYRVINLRRTGYGPLTLDGLAPGRWRHLSEQELSALR